MDTEPIITTDEMSALLGRALNEQETAHYALYLDIATTRLEGLLGGSLPAPMPSDVKMVLAQVFGLITTEQQLAQNANDGGPVSSKRVEDFQISYDTTAGAAWDGFVKQYADVIAKYRVVAGVRVSGRNGCNDCL